MGVYIDSKWRTRGVLPVLAVAVSVTYAAAVVFTPSLAGRNLYEISPKSYLIPVLNGSISEGKRIPARKATSSFAKVTCTIFMPGEESRRFYVKARCYRSLKKNEEPHYLAVILKESDGRASVDRVHCSCKGGSGGHCNHIFALLYQLNDYSCLNIKDIPIDVTCTSRPQS